MKYVFCNFIIILLSLIPAQLSRACEPENYFLFKEEAREKLDFLTKNKPANIFDQIILLHNLAFHKDKESRLMAEKLLNRTRPDSSQVNIIKAFGGSLDMIKVSQSNTTSKLLKTISPFNKSPKKEALIGFSLISEAVEAEPDNKIIRCLRATAAAESMEHLPELYKFAEDDLLWLDARINTDDSVAVFFVSLNWAKYYYKLWKKKGDFKNLEKSKISCARAIAFACTPVYSKWAQEWQNRIDSSMNENK